MALQFAMNNAAASMPIASGANRKRKDMEDDDADLHTHDHSYFQERVSNSKGSRQWARLPNSEEEAQFHPLPAELNLQVLANLGYNVTDQQADFSDRSSSGHFHGFDPSPSSSASDLCPSTPLDAMSGSAESYFTKGIRSETTPSYPTFNIYPEHVYPRPPGLLGMHMHRSTPSDVSVSTGAGDGMEVDGHLEQSSDVEAGPSHGPHCRSIPQLHCRGTGATKELWAHCRDCGTMSQVDCAPIGDALSYSP